MTALVLHHRRRLAYEAHARAETAPITLAIACCIAMGAAAVVAAIGGM